MNNLTDIPIIKLIVIEDKYYLYDTFTNKILHISKNHYNEIIKLCSIGLTEYKNLNLSHESYKDIMSLIKKGYLNSSFINKIEHPYTKYLPILTQRCLSTLVLQVTRNCNFKCRYCLYATDNTVERNHEKASMSFDLAKKSIDYFFDHSMDSKEVNIVFYGGEPLLNFKLIRDIVNYCEEIFQSKRVIYYITTNGSLLNDEIINFLAKNKFNLSISLDGPPEIQNMHRRFLSNGGDTFDKVYGNVQRIRSLDNSYFNEYVTFLPVVFGDEIQEVFSFFESQNIPLSKVQMKYANTNGIDYWTNIYHLKNYSEISNLKNLYHPQAINYTMHKKALDTPSVYNEFWHHNGPCVPGVWRLFVDIYGNFYPCEKCVENSCYRIGNIHSGIDMEISRRFLNVGKISEDNCKKCWAIKFCNICIEKCGNIETNSICSLQKQIVCQEIKKHSFDFLKQYIQEQSKREICNE